MESLTGSSLRFSCYRGTAEGSEDWYNRGVDNKRHWLVEFFRWDARTILATSLGLAILVGLTLAATELNLVVAFDFGGASLADKASGMIQVKGGLSAYPKQSDNFTYGWATAGISEFSDKTVTDLMKRDYNTGSAGTIFRIAGLEQGNYNFKATVGSSSNALSTRMTIGNLASSVTVPAGTWQTTALVTTVDTGTADIVFNSGNGVDSWGISGLSVYSVTGAVSEPTFVVTTTPVRQTITAGNATVFTIGVTSIDNYASTIEAQVSGLVSGMTAGFVPAQLIRLPGTMNLTIYTTDAIASANYSLLVTITGKDTNFTKRTMPIGLTIVSPTIDLPTVDNQTPVLPIRTSKEVKSDFNKLDTFVAEEKAKVVGRNNFLEIKGVADALSSISTYESMPEPKTTVESILQKLVTTGIISSTSDNAPPVHEPPKATGFWRGMWQSIFRPAT